MLRLVPNDVVQAAAIVSWLKKYPTCHTVAAAAFSTGKTPSTESTALIAAIAQTAKLYGLGYLAVPSPGNNAKNYEPYVAGLAGKVTCFVLTGRVTRAAIEFTNELKAKLVPGSVIVGTNSFCNAGWSDQARGGVSAEVDPVLYCTTPVLPLERYPNGKSFRSKYQQSEHRTPTAYTYYGYLAATLVLQAISDIGNDDSRRQVRLNLVNNGPSTDLETYTFDGNGDLSGTAANLLRTRQDPRRDPDVRQGSGAARVAALRGLTRLPPRRLSRRRPCFSPSHEASLLQNGESKPEGAWVCVCLVRAPLGVNNVVHRANGSE